MIGKAVLFFEQIDEKVTELEFSEILKISIMTKGLPKNKGDLYFMLSSFEALNLIEKKPRQIYKLNWDVLKKMRKEGGF